jgi:hypothetical protein
LLQKLYPIVGNEKFARLETFCSDCSSNEKREENELLHFGE